MHIVSTFLPKKAGMTHFCVTYCALSQVSQRMLYRKSRGLYFKYGMGISSIFVQFSRVIFSWGKSVLCLLLVVLLFILKSWPQHGEKAKSRKGAAEKGIYCSPRRLDLHTWSVWEIHLLKICISSSFSKSQMCRCGKKIKMACTIVT